VQQGGLAGSRGTGQRDQRARLDGEADVVSGRHRLAGNPETLAAVLRRQRVHLLTELRSLDEARATAAGSPVVALLVKAAELHVRADLGVVDAAEHDLTPAALAALRLPAAPAADLGTQSSSA